MSGKTRQSVIGIPHREVAMTEVKPAKTIETMATEDLIGGQY